MYTDTPVHQYTSSVYFLIFGITCTVTFPLICWGMHTQILMLRLCLRTKTYLSPQLLVYLPLNVPDHDPGSSFSYFKYSIWLTAKIYPSVFYCSTCPQIYAFMSIPVQYFSLFSITYTLKFPLICSGTYTQIQPEINLPVYLHTAPLSNNKDLPVTTNTCVPAHRCTLPWHYLFIFILYFRLNAKIYPSTFLQQCMTPFICLFSCFSFV